MRGWEGRGAVRGEGAKVQTGLRPVQRCKRGRLAQVPVLGSQVSRLGCRCGYIHLALDSVLGASRLCHSMTTNPLDRMYRYSSMSGL